MSAFARGSNDRWSWKSAKRVLVRLPSFAALMILEPEHMDVWLDTETDPKLLGPLLARFDGAFTVEPVSKAVNNQRSDYPEMIAAL